jgi:hypothetical protein
MKPSPLLSLLLYFICLPSVSAWIFTWHEPNGKLQAFHDDNEMNCEKMDNPVGNVFDWSPQAGHWCIFLYENDKCEEPSAGNTCKTYAWTNHPSTKHLLSFKVMNNTAGFDPSTAIPSATTTTTTDAKPSPTSKVVTTTTDTKDAASSSPGASSIDSEPTVSGGAIAGIVVGVVAAVAIAGILVFFLIRRRRKNAVQPGATTENPAFGMAELSNGEKSASSGPGYQAELASPNEEKSSALNRPRHHAQGYRELHGSAVASEIGGVERHEIGGTQIDRDRKY